MKAFLSRLAGALLAGLLLACSSCATERYAPGAEATVDSTLTAAGLPPLHVHKLVFRGPVTVQVGQGNTSTTTGTDKTGQRAQAVSTGANSPVVATTKKVPTPWYVFAGVAVLAVALWEWCRRRFNPLGWLPWARLG